MASSDPSSTAAKAMHGSVRGAVVARSVGVATSDTVGTSIAGLTLFNNDGTANDDTESAAPPPPLTNVKGRSSRRCCNVGWWRGRRRCCCLHAAAADAHGPVVALE